MASCSAWLITLALILSRNGAGPVASVVKRDSSRGRVHCLATAHQAISAHAPVVVRPGYEAPSVHQSENRSAGKRTSARWVSGRWCLSSREPIRIASGDTTLSPPPAPLDDCGSFIEAVVHVRVNRGYARCGPGTLRRTTVVRRSARRRAQNPFGPSGVRRSLVSGPRG
jgi:hypothetical protein